MFCCTECVCQDSYTWLLLASHKHKHAHNHAHTLATFVGYKCDHQVTATFVCDIDSWVSFVDRIRYYTNGQNNLVVFSFACFFCELVAVSFFGDDVHCVDVCCVLFFRGWGGAAVVR